MKAIHKILKSKLWILWILLVLFSINWMASNWHLRVDLTNEKRFTLSAPTQNILKKIDNPITVDVFLKGNFPSGFKRLSIATEDLLNEFKEVAGNKFNYHFISPDELMEGTSTTYADTLSSMGFFPINLTSQIKEGQQQQLVYPVALVHYKDRTQSIELYKGKTPLINFQELNSAEALLEYNVANAIAKITQIEKPVIGYAIGNGEPMGYETYDLVENILSPNYRFYTIDLLKQPTIPLEFKALLLVKPTQGFTEIEKLKLDQYLMNGGKILMFIEKLNAELDSLQIKNEVIAYDRRLNLDDQLFKYGVRINPDLIMDLQCDYLPFDVNGNGQFDFLPWNYFPVFESNSNHPITKNIGFVSGKFVNSIDTVEVEGIQKTILLQSSANSRTIATPALISSKENVTAPENDKYKRAGIPVAVLLEGKFKSLFSNRLSAAMNDSLELAGSIFLPQCIIDNKMIVVSDGDMVLNAVVKGNQPIQMGMNAFTYGTQREFPFANKDFLQNSLDYLINENGLSEAKAKDYVVRLLDTKKVNESRVFWQCVNIVAPILIVIFFAFIFQWIRKRKYATI